MREERHTCIRLQMCKMKQSPKLKKIIIYRCSSPTNALLYISDFEKWKFSFFLFRTYDFAFKSATCHCCCCCLFVIVVAVCLTVVVVPNLRALITKKTLCFYNFLNYLITYTYIHAYHHPSEGDSLSDYRHSLLIMLVNNYITFTFPLKSETTTTEEGKRKNFTLIFHSALWSDLNGHNSMHFFFPFASIIISIAAEFPRKAHQ
jgi:hypothetical protein